MINAGMTKHFYKIAAPLFLFFFSGVVAAQTQEVPPRDHVFPGFEQSAVVVHISARVIEPNQEEILNTSNYKVTISGRPVTLQLTGKNIIVLARFTPYISRDGSKFLAAQGQVWTDIPNEGVSYYSNIHTVELDFNEQIIFFPLGSQADEDGTRIEIQLMLTPYEESSSSSDPSGESID
jgi:hypothetical protein